VESYTLITEKNSINIAPDANVNGAVITVNDSVVGTGMTSYPIPLTTGENTISIVITAKDGSTTKTYTIIITKNPGTSANLDSLTLSIDSMLTTFLPGNTTYALTALMWQDTLNLVPTTVDTNATITINGDTVKSDNVSKNIILNSGANVITIVVTAEDLTTTQTYTLNITKDYDLTGTWNLTQTFEFGPFTGTNRTDLVIFKQSTQDQEFDLIFGLSETYQLQSHLERSVKGSNVKFTIANNLGDKYTYLGSFSANGDTVTGFMDYIGDENSTFNMVRVSDSLAIPTIQIPEGSGFVIDSAVAEWDAISPIITDEVGDTLFNGGAGADIEYLKLATVSGEDSLRFLIKTAGNLDTTVKYEIHFYEYSTTTDTLTGEYKVLVINWIPSTWQVRSFGNGIVLLNNANPLDGNFLEGAYRFGDFFGGNFFLTNPFIMNVITAHTDSSDATRNYHDETVFKALGHF